MDEIRALYEKELAKHRDESAFLSMVRRKGSAVDIPLKFRSLPDDRAEPLLNMWKQFHNAAKHRTYAGFYDKISYCSELRMDTLDESVFLQLISDRSFLFLNYSEAGTDPEYPTLSRLVTSYEACMECYEPENVEKVWRQGFVPSDANLQDYHAFQRNLRQLTEAVALRRELLSDPPSLPQEFDLTIPNEEGILCQCERWLSKLFHCYLEACEKQAYVKWASFRADKAAPSRWNNAIHAVWQYTSQTPGYWDPAACALVFFHLFTQKGQKLAAGTLHQYRFEKIKVRTTSMEDPNSTQLRIHKRIRCNIQLYDQLLELFVDGRNLSFPTDESRADYYRRAKFLFYQYSRYDRYWHYDLHGFWDNGPDPSFGFHYVENHTDGVDELGNLLRHHIHYCLPNQVQWLIPVLQHDRREPPLSVLTTFLLAESTMNLPPNKRLVHKVQKLLNSPDGEKLVEDYMGCWTDQPRVLKLLSEACKEHNLNIPREELVLYEMQGGTSVQRCSQYVLEYFLKERMIQSARSNLGRIAKTYFDALCLGSFSFDET